MPSIPRIRQSGICPCTTRMIEYLSIALSLKARDRNTGTDRRLYGGGLFNVALVISSIALVGVYSVPSIIGFTIG